MHSDRTKRKLADTKKRIIVTVKTLACKEKRKTNHFYE